MKKQIRVQTQVRVGVTKIPTLYKPVVWEKSN